MREKIIAAIALLLVAGTAEAQESKPTHYVPMVSYGPACHLVYQDGGEGYNYGPCDPVAMPPEARYDGPQSAFTPEQCEAMKKRGDYKLDCPLVPVTSQPTDLDRAYAICERHRTAIMRATYANEYHAVGDVIAYRYPSEWQNSCWAIDQVHDAPKPKGAAAIAKAAAEQEARDLEFVKRVSEGLPK